MVQCGSRFCSCVEALLLLLRPKVSVTCESNATRLSIPDSAKVFGPSLRIDTEVDDDGRHVAAFHYYCAGQPWSVLV